MIVDRIKQIIEYKGISARQFCLKIGVANGFLDKVKDVGSEKVAKILCAFPEINPEWLLMGEGSMLRPQANRTGHVVVSNDFKGGTNHIGDISISNGIETSPLSARESQYIDDQAIRDRQHQLIAENERLKSVLKTQESMIEWLQKQCEEERAHNRSLVNELLGKSKA